MATATTGGEFVITADRMAAVDRNATVLGVTQRQLMESSGNAVAAAVRDVADTGDMVVILAGRGNNGGDAFVAARFLGEYAVSVRLLGRPESITTGVAHDNWAALEAAEFDIAAVHDSRDLALGDPDVIVDGMLGTGVRGPPREPIATGIDRINESRSTVISIDVPSGVDADTGEAAGPVVEPDRVVTFHDVKPALVDAEYEVDVTDIGIPDAAERFVGPGDVAGLERPSSSHKGDFGRVMVIGGGPYTGAPALAALGALRAGADLTYLAVPESIADVVAGYAPDLIVESYSGEALAPRVVDRLLADAVERDVVVIGPGLGAADDTREAIRAFLTGYDGRCVVDADALDIVPEIETGATVVCTPHRGELQEMGGPMADDWRERADRVAAFSRDLGHTLLVKGEYDVISDGDVTRVNRTGNPGMTVGGTGDVLAGVVGSLLAVEAPVTAASIGAYVNGRAGDLVVDDRGYGLMASDLPDALPVALWGDRDG